MRQLRPSKAQKQQFWMAQFEKSVLAIKPELAGKIDWTDGPYYFFLTGLSPEEAAHRYTSE